MVYKSLTPLLACQEAKTKVVFLEKKLADLQAENKPVGPVLKQLIQTLCEEEVGGPLGFYFFLEI